MSATYKSIHKVICDTCEKPISESFNEFYSISSSDGAHIFHGNIKVDNEITHKSLYIESPLHFCSFNCMVEYLRFRLGSDTNE